jgi:lipopolysaccharide biosynthesis glycosyltransferase
LTFIEADVRPIQDLVSSTRFPVSVYLRFLIPFCLPVECEKVIYLDSDLLVLENLSELWDMDVSNVPVAALHESNTHSAHAFGRILGMESSMDTKYFNTGVLVMNLTRWRQERISERAIECAKRYAPVIWFPDQDTLNMVIGGNFLSIDPDWNVMPIVKSYEIAHFSYTRPPKIIHFGMPRKPWVPGCSVSEKELFFQYLEQTAWKDYQISIKQKLDYLVARKKQRFKCFFFSNIPYNDVPRMYFYIRRYCPRLIGILDRLGLKEPIKRFIAPCR